MTVETEVQVADGREKVEGPLGLRSHLLPATYTTPGLSADGGQNGGYWSAKMGDLGSDIVKLFNGIVMLAEASSKTSRADSGQETSDAAPSNSSQH